MSSKRKKQSKREPQNKTTMLEALGMKRVTDLFHNERLHFFLGMVLLAVSVCMLLSFVSFLTTGQADQTLIETPKPGEMANENHAFQNLCGSVGAYVSHFLVKRCFGLPAFIIPVFLFVVSLNLMRAYKANLMKWFMCLSLVMIWFSIALARYVTPWFQDLHYSLGGDHGHAVGKWVEGFVGTPGLTALLLIIAVLFLMYVSTETFYFMR